MNPVPGQLLGVLYEPYRVRFCADEAATLAFASECLVALLSPRRTKLSLGQPRPTESTPAQPPVNEVGLVQAHSAHSPSTEPILIALTGDLGAGKTTWVRGMAAVFGLQEQVHSPTYALKHEYGNPVRLQHLDLYRLGDGADFTDLAELGLDETGPRGTDSPTQETPLITCVEWPERMPQGTTFNHWFHLAYAAGDPTMASEAISPAETEGRTITWFQRKTSSTESRKAVTASPAKP